MNTKKKSLSSAWLKAHGKATLLGGTGAFLAAGVWAANSLMGPRFESETMEAARIGAPAMGVIGTILIVLGTHTKNKKMTALGFTMITGSTGLEMFDLHQKSVPGSSPGEDYIWARGAVTTGLAALFNMLTVLDAFGKKGETYLEMHMPTPPRDLNLN